MSEVPTVATIQIERDKLFPDGQPHRIQGAADEIARVVGNRFAIFLAGMCVVARYEIWNIECVTQEEADYLVAKGGHAVTTA